MTGQPPPAIALVALAAILGLGACSFTRPPLADPDPAPPPQGQLGTANDPPKSQGGGPSEAAAVTQKTTGTAGRLLIFSSTTGHIPLGSAARAGRFPVGFTQADREAARAAALEAEIDDELRRQEDLSGRTESEQGTALAATGTDVAADDAGAGEDPRIAPSAPEDRDLPESSFEEARVTIPPGSWENDAPIEALRRTLDSDGDGIPEQVRYIDERSGATIRKEVDRDHDGRIDCWSAYESGSLSKRVLDSNGDETPDVWESYAQNRLASRTVDRDHDGVKDTYYRYDGESLLDERHDANGDGMIDLVVTYQHRIRTRSQEDRNRDGQMDTWTTYRVVNGEEIVARVERASKGRGSPDIFETFGVEDGKAVLVKREEDTDGDGAIDVTWIFENGEAIRRETTRPDLAPL